MNIFIGNLSYDVSEEELRGLFTTYGNVTNVALTGDSSPRISATQRDSQYTSRESRAYAYVEMPNETEALAAILGVQGMHMGGRPVTVVQAMPLEKKKTKSR